MCYRELILYFFFLFRVCHTVLLITILVGELALLSVVLRLRCSAAVANSQHSCLVTWLKIVRVCYSDNFLLLLLSEDRRLPLNTMACWRIVLACCVAASALTISAAQTGGPVAGKMQNMFCPCRGAYYVARTCADIVRIFSCLLTAQWVWIYHSIACKRRCKNNIFSSSQVLGVLAYHYPMRRSIFVWWK